jgi:hypothetical protein
MKRKYEVEVTVIGTANIVVEAASRDEAMAQAEDEATIIHAADWQYDATGVREHWVAETPDEALIVGA